MFRSPIVVLFHFVTVLLGSERKRNGARCLGAGGRLGTAGRRLVVPAAVRWWWCGNDGSVVVVLVVFSSIVVIITTARIQNRIVILQRGKVLYGRRSCDDAPPCWTIVTLSCGRWLRLLRHHQQGQLQLMLFRRLSYDLLLLLSSILLLLL
jgi:hypothetical protein